MFFVDFIFSVCYVNDYSFNWKDQKFLPSELGFMFNFLSLVNIEGDWCETKIIFDEKWLMRKDREKEKCCYNNHNTAYIVDRSSFCSMSEHDDS